MTKADILAELLKKRTCRVCGQTKDVGKFRRCPSGTRDRTCHRCRNEAFKTGQRTKRRLTFGPERA